MSERRCSRGQANWFLPFRKKRERAGWGGRFYSGLESLAPITRCSPMRRLVQVACLTLFLVAFFVICWPYAETFGETTLSDKEAYPVDLLLLLDPLVGVSTAIAGRFINGATFGWTVAILVFCILIPRAFCGYLCPLGTCIDLFDWCIGRWFKRLHVPDNGSKAWWVHLKYYLLTGILVASACGLLLSGFAAAIPVLTRGMLFTLGRVQLAWLKSPSHLFSVDGTYYLSVLLFLGVFLLSLLGRRFWCRYVCPSGALLSVFNVLRIGQRQVEETCIHCNKCIEVCPFDAIQDDFHTRVHDCTYCQTCGGICPTGAIKFVTRWNRIDLKAENDPALRERPVSRRAFVGVAAGSGIAAGLAHLTGTRLTGAAQGQMLPNPVRPPGSVPESLFLDLCIRCGQCFKVCPGPVLDAAGWEHGWESMWTPVARLDHAGCHQNCNFCTQVCPTGAIQPLNIEVKRKTHMGLACVDATRCLPMRKEERLDCDLCYVECQQAGYHAIEMRYQQIELDPPPPPGAFSDIELEEMSRIRVPVIDSNLCVGCGICQYRCFTTYVIQRGQLDQSAIVVLAENEHRLDRFPCDPNQLPPAGET